MAFDVGDILSIINGIFLYCVILVLMYHGYRYWENRTHIVFIKRYCNVTICEVALAVLHFAFGGTAWFLIDFNDSGLSAYSWNKLPDFLMSVQNICWCGVQYCWLIRFSALSYDLNLVNYHLQHEWQSIINPHGTSKQDGQLRAYAIRKSKYKNLSYLARIFLPLLLTQIVIEIAQTQYVYGALYPQREDLYYVLQFVQYCEECLPYLVLFFIYRNIPKINDNFFIAAELKRIFRCTVLFFISTGIDLLGLIAYMLGRVTKDDREIVVICVIFMASWTYIACAISSILMSTWWVNKVTLDLLTKHQVSKAKVEKSQQQFSYVVLDDEQSVSENGFIDRIEESKSVLLLRQCLRDKEMFQSFMHFVTKDLCAHQLLAFVEIIQLQQSIAATISGGGYRSRAKDGQIRDGLYERILFYRGFPKSDIVHRFKPQKYDTHGESMMTAPYNSNSIGHGGITVTKDMDEKQIQLKILKSRAHELFIKYIEYGAYYECQVQDTTRLQLVDAMQHKYEFVSEENVNIFVLLHLFDPVVDELFDSLTNSFSRFRRTRAFSTRRSFQMIQLSV